MKILKNKLKIILVLFIGVIIGSCITVYATGILAGDIKYNKQDGTQTDVETALNDLYQNQKNSKQFAAYYTTRLYTTSFTNIELRDYNSNLVNDSTGNVISIKEPGKYQLDYVSYYGYSAFNVDTNYCVNSVATALVTSCPTPGYYVVSEHVEINLQKNDTFFIQSKMSKTPSSVGTVSAVLYKIN